MKFVEKAAEGTGALVNTIAKQFGSVAPTEFLHRLGDRPEVRAVLKGMDEDRRQKRRELLAQREALRAEEKKAVARVVKAVQDAQQRLDVKRLECTAAEEEYRAREADRFGTCENFSYRLRLLEGELRELSMVEIDQFHEDCTALFDYLRGAMAGTERIEPILTRWGIRIPGYQGNYAALKTVIDQLNRVLHEIPALYVLPDDQVAPRIAELRASIEFHHVGTPLPEKKQAARPFWRQNYTQPETLFRPGEIEARQKQIASLG